MTADPEVSRKWNRLIGALGGVGNIAVIEPCAETRLRLVVHDEAALRTAGAWGVMRVADRTMHLLVGLHADRYAAEMKARLATMG